LLLADAGLKRDFNRLNELMKRYVNPLYALRERSKGYEVAVMKEAMELLGMAAGPVRPPLMNCKVADRDDLARLLKVYADVL